MIILISLTEGWTITLLINTCDVFACLRFTLFIPSHAGLWLSGDTFSFLFHNLAILNILKHLSYHGLDVMDFAKLCLLPFWEKIYFPYTLWECCRECAKSAPSPTQMQKTNPLNFLVWFCWFFLQLSRMSSPLISLYIRSINWWNVCGYLLLHLVEGSFIQQDIFFWDGLIGDYFNFELCEMTPEEFFFS